jgi:Bacterial SH3 domain
MSELRASAANQFMEKIKAVESLDIAKRFSEMQATLGTSLSNKLLEASRSVADQWNSTFKHSQQLMQIQMAAIDKSVDFSKIAGLQAFADRSAFKDFAAITSVSKDLFRPLAGLEGAFKDSLSQRFQEMSTSLDSSFKASAAQAALAYSQTLPRFDERIAEAMREFKALGDLKAGDSTLAGVGTVTESPDIVSAKGERHAADVAHTNPVRRSAIELWWERLPIELKVFFLVLLFILKSMSEEIIHEHVKGWTGAHSQAEKQVAYNYITQNFGEDTAWRLRCIRASMLKVRQEPAATGRILDSLPRGTPVEVLESQGSWSRIRYRALNSSDIREGWAASGYLSFEIC